MAEPDVSLGYNVSFDGPGFRNAIRFAMQMGLNPDAGRRPIFIQKAVGRTYWKNNVQLVTPPRVDRDGRPFDPDVEVRKADDQQILVDCAVEIERAEAEELPVGTFRPTRLVATLLDEQYLLVKDCRELVYNGDRYIYAYEPESNGLFDVGVYTMIFYVKEET